jgi:hypothetical protein
MTDIEIDKALALAIGWPIVWRSRDGKVWVSNNIMVVGRVFDYRDWNVIGPIAERYDAFPYRLRIAEERGWNVFTYKDNVADIPQKAIALAVIGEAK